jgi:hypothetical protein
MAGEPASGSGPHLRGLPHRPLLGPLRCPLLRDVSVALYYKGQPNSTAWPLSLLSLPAEQFPLRVLIPQTRCSERYHGSG